MRCNFTRPVSENSESSGWDKQCKVTMSQLICTLDHFVTLPCFVLHLWHCDSLQRAWAWPGTDAAKFSSVWTVANSSELSGHTVVCIVKLRAITGQHTHWATFNLNVGDTLRGLYILCPRCPQQVLCHLLTFTEHLNLPSSSDGRWLVAEMVPWLCGPMRAEMPMVMVSNRRDQDQWRWPDHCPGSNHTALLLKTQFWSCT